jgi:hypothetical protein
MHSYLTSINNIISFDIYKVWFIVFKLRYQLKVFKTTKQIVSLDNCQ